MKRIFTNLKAYASVAMAIAVMGVASLGVSCKYDDTAIYDEIEDVKGDLDGVKGDLAELEERVAALETKVNTEVAALQALVVTAKTEILDEVDDKFAVVNGSIEEVEEALAEKYAELAAKDKELADQLKAMEAAIGKVITAQQKPTGEWVLTLSDGKEITVYPQTKQEYHGVTVKEENGIYYWAQYSKEGIVSFIKDAEGNKYPLHHATPVVDMEVIEGNVNDAVTEAMSNIQIRITDEGETEMTLDGGETWYAMGGGDTSLFTGATQDLAAGTATFTLVGGEEIVVALAQEAEPEMMFAIKSGKLYFTNEQTQEIKLAAELVEEVFVLSAPAGWVVEYDGKNLVVTAPSYVDVVDTEIADEEGWIKVLATGTDKGAIVAKVKVSVSELGLFIELLGDGTFNINNTMTYMEGDQPMAMPFYYGVVSADGFSAAALKQAVTDYKTGYMQEALSSLEEPVEIGWLYTNLNSYYDYDLWEYVEPEIELGGNYIIWAAPHSMVTYDVDWDNLTYVEYKNVVATAEVTKVLFNDAEVKVVMAGYNGYYLNLYESQYADSVADDLEQAKMYIQWGYDFQFGVYCEDEGFEGSLCTVMNQEVRPGTAYTLYLLPWDAAADPTEITVDDLLKVEFTTTALTAGATGAPTFAIDKTKTNYTTVAGKLTPAEDAVLTYYKWYTAEEMAAFADDAALLANVIDWSDWMKEPYLIKEATDVQKNGLAQGTTMYLASVSINADGQYGELLKQEITTLSVTYSDVTLTVSDNAISADALDYSFKVAATGDIAKVRYEWIDVTASYYNRWKNTYKSSAEEAQLYMATAAEDDYYVETAGAANEYGFYTIPVPAFDASYKLVIGAVDTEGKATAVVVVDVDSTFDVNVIKQYLDDGSINPVWDAAKPTVTFSTQIDPTDPTFTDVTVSVVPGAGAVKCWMGKFNLYSTQLATVKVKSIMSNWNNNGREQLTAQEDEMGNGSGAYNVGYFTSESEAVTYTMTNTNTYGHIHITWIDAEGNFYEPYCVEWNPTAEEEEPEIA